jgi:hypothetical protein
MGVIFDGEGREEGELFIMNFQFAVFKNSRECVSLKKGERGDLARQAFLSLRCQHFALYILFIHAVRLDNSADI